MEYKLRILFIDVINQNVRLQDSYPHLGISYLISYLRKYINCDIDVRVINQNYIKHLKSFKPDVIALSSVTQNFKKAKEISWEIKNNNPALPILIGGVHISSLPESIDENMDIGVIGEGEETFLELIKHFRTNGSFREGIENIKGIVFRQEGIIVKTRGRERIFPLDNIPHPDRSILPNKENQLLLTSRGCPYKCAFCSSGKFWNKIRYFSSDYVLEEIEQIVKYYPIINLAIYDDLFTFNKKRLSEISSKIASREYHKKISFWCNVRANHLDKETIKYLKDMNIKGVGIGLESGSDNILKKYKSDNISVDINIKAISLCKDNGIFVHGSFMLGFPYETEEDMIKTYEFIKNSNIDKGEISVATPLPGTKFWDYAIDEKLVSNDMDWSKLAIRYIDDPPTTENFILLSSDIKKDRFLKIFYDIVSIITVKAKEYEKKWEKIQGRQINIYTLFSFLNIKKMIKDPRRGIRYIVNFILSIPDRFLILIQSNQK